MELNEFQSKWSKYLNGLERQMFVDGWKVSLKINMDCNAYSGVDYRHFTDITIIDALGKADRYLSDRFSKT